MTKTVYAHRLLFCRIAGTTQLLQVIQFTHELTPVITKYTITDSTTAKATATISRSLN